MESLRQHLQGGRLQEAVHFERPDLPKLLLGIMREEIITKKGAAYMQDFKHHMDVTFCGSSHVSAVVSHACRSANNMASALDIRGLQFQYRTEQYGLGSRQKESSVERNSSRVAVVPVTSTPDVIHPQRASSYAMSIQGDRTADIIGTWEGGD